MAKYRESATILHDSELDALIARTYGLLEQRRAKSQMTEQMSAEGMTQFRSGKHREGLALLKQSLTLHPAKKRQDILSQLEAWLVQIQTATAQLPGKAPVPVEGKAFQPAAGRTSTSARAETAARPLPQTPVEVTAGSRWRGAVLFRLSEDWIQWPLQVTVHPSYNLTGSSIEQDPRTQGRVEYSASGIYEPQQKVWYMVCIRRDRRSRNKATCQATCSTTRWQAALQSLFSRMRAGGGTSQVCGGCRASNRLVEAETAIIISCTAPCDFF